MRTKFLAFLCACFFITYGYAAQAQNDEEDDQLRKDVITKVASKDQDKFLGVTYFRPTFQHMSKMAWHFGYPDIDNNYHVDIFLQINECELFEKYFKNEFEWQSIRDAMRDYIINNREVFERRLFFDTEITVGRYNQQNNFFPVTTDNFISGWRNFYPHASSLGWTHGHCGYDTPNSDIYPRFALFEFQRPFAIRKININREVAQQIVKEWNERQVPNRNLYLRFYITLQKFKEFRNFASYVRGPVYNARVDGSKIFPNKEMTQPIDSRDFLNRR